MDVCASGQSSDEGYGPGGLALALLQAGIPAVIVMQEDMAQRAAGLTAQHFYAALRRGDNISQALAAGRQAVRLQQDDPIHWSVPAHYSQQHAYDAAADLFLVDALLDSLERQHIRIVLIVAALLLILAHLSYGFATVAARDFSSVSVLLVESSLLPVLGALLSRRGERQLQERFDPDSRAWLKVLQSKYFSAAVWAGLAWLGVALLLLAITWAGLWPRLALTSRQALWAVSHLWVTFAAYTGARQALRQNLLFLREGTVGSWWIGWLIMLVLLFMPLIVYGLAVQFVGLTFFNGTGGVLVVLLFLLVLAQLSGRSEFPLD